MNPTYRFTLSANGGDERAAFPVYRDDVSKDFELQTNQEFYRAKLSGKLTFVRDDYDFIASQSFDTQFGIKIYISYDAGQTWTEYWTGNFWKTNCTFNDDDKNVTLTPDVVDQYNDVLAGMEKEYNLIDLAPEIVPVQLDKRSMVQVYVPGQTVIGCFLSGMWWEQECESVTDENALEHTYFFAKNKTARLVDVTQQGTPVIPELFWGDTYTGVGTTDYVNGAYKFEHVYVSQSGGAAEYFYIKRVSDDQIMWWVAFVNQSPRTYPIELTLQPYEGSGATGNIKLYIHDMSVWARRVCDVESAAGLDTQPIPDDDIVDNNRNYTRVIPYFWPDTIVFYDYLSETPTQWGLYQPGKYYVMYTNVYAGVDKSFPIARSAWGRLSIWFVFPFLDWTNEKRWRKQYTLKDAYPLASVISVLLAQVAPNLTHLETTDYSQFLYGTNPLFGIKQRIFITPKSNLISLGYDQPAQKAPITLKRVLDMLRDCFRCYWFVDDQNRFRIEHIEYFRRGGAYTGTPVVGRDLTVEQVTRNGKKWAFGTSEFKFDKPEMAARYQFGWMDDVTQLFDGNPLEIVSKYVNPENIEQIDISQFTSDVDYILLTPGEISKDGFVLLSTIQEDNIYNASMLHDNTLTNNTGLILSQDGWKSICVPVTPGMTITVGGFYLGRGGYYALYNDSTLVSVGSYGDPNGGSVAPITIPNGVNLLWMDVVSPLSPQNPISNLYVKDGIYKLPYLDIGNPYDPEISLQNGWVSFYFLQQYYFWDMPARYFKYNGQMMAAMGIKKLKTQTLKFPAYTDPNTLQLIKTNLGNGTIQKMSVNLSSRNAQTTLKYDTE